MANGKTSVLSKKTISNMCLATMPQKAPLIKMPGWMFLLLSETAWVSKISIKSIGSSLISKMCLMDLGKKS